jgi:hypothetical protein
MIEQDNNDENRENILLLNNKYSVEKENSIEKNTITNTNRIMNNIQQVK